MAYAKRCKPVVLEHSKGELARDNASLECGPVGPVTIELDIVAQANLNIPSQASQRMEPNNRPRGAQLCTFGHWELECLPRRR